MTPKERAVMQQALKALENNLPINYVENGLGEKFPCFSNDPLRESNTRAAIIALREALSEQALQKLSDFHQSIEQADEESKTTDYMLGFSDGKNYAHKYEQAEREHDGHWSDCSVHNEPAYPNGPCDCGGYPPKHWRCACGANLYIDSNGAPASKAEQAEQEQVEWGVDWAECGGVPCASIIKKRNDGTIEVVAIEFSPFPTPTEIINPGSGMFTKTIQERARAELLAEQAEQEPVVKIHKYNEFQTLGSLNLPIGTKVYAAPVRTKDLTDEEQLELARSSVGKSRHWLVAAVIAKYKEKNK